MQKFLLSLPALLFTIVLLSQEKISYLDYELVYDDVAKSAEKGEYNKVLEHLDRINHNDSIYCTAMVSKSYYLLSTKRYDEALEIVAESLKKDCEEVRGSFYINKIVALMGQENAEEANKACDEAMKEFPMNKTLWYNKGTALEKLGKIPEAAEAYKKALMVDPLYKKSYLQLGNIYYRQDLLSQAYMLFNMYLLLEPDAEGAIEILKSLNNIVQSKNENKRNPNIRLSKNDDAFKEIDLILRNRVALNAAYSIGNEIDIAITKQNHALIKSLENFKGQGGFWDDVVASFYQWIGKEGHFDNFTYTLSYSIENESYKKVVEKNHEEIVEFLDLAKEKWLELLRNGAIEKNAEGKQLSYYYKDGYLQGIGSIESNHFVGPWKLYDEQGRFSGIGTFNSEGIRNAKWTWFYINGKIKETANYKAGQLDGENLFYFENGKPKIVSHYKGDKLHGNYKYYNEQGAQQQEKHFEQGELDGTLLTFHDIGEELVKSSSTYDAGELTGEYLEYFPTGQVYKKIQCSQGKTNGPETQYYLNGKKALEAHNVNGLLEGSYKLYHENGSLMEEGHTTEGLYDGPWKAFYADGTLKAEFTYNKGALHGEYQYYDTDGKLHYVYEYRNGEIIAYRFLDKQGKVIHENRKKGGEFFYKGYSPQGKVTTEGLYDIKGGKIGNWKFYSEYGWLSEEGEFVENKAQGIHKTYFEDGSLASSFQYKNDTLQGYYVSYFKNGAISRQGWYKDNNAHGVWKSYTPEGKTTAVNFYHKGLFHGIQSYFSGNGIKSQESFYTYGDLIRDIYYGINGQASEVIEYKHDQEKYTVVSKHPNGKMASSRAYINGIKHGLAETYDFFGNKLFSGNYLNGQPHGEWIWYYENGQKEVVANYLFGKLEGDYTYFYNDGSIETKYLYKLDKIDGVVTGYHENGEVYAITNYSDGTRHGRHETYGIEGNLQLVRFYEHNRIIGYSYLDNNAIEKPMIPVNDQSGKLTTYYSNGKPSRIMEYKNGKLDGEYKEFFFNGQLMEELTYDMGNREGTTTEYYANGNLKVVAQYRYGERHGVYKEYFENGNLKKEEHYFDGIKDGTSKHYNNEGIVIKEETFLNDTIQSASVK